MKTQCAGAIVLGPSGTLALVRRRPETKWFFPKGHVDEGESLEDAALREVAEETGLTDLEYIDKLGSYTRPGIDKDGNDTEEEKEIHMFLYSAEGSTELAPTHEIAEAKWDSLPHIADMLDNAKDRAWFATVFPRVRQAIQRD